jgi:hypothetical protein
MLERPAMAKKTAKQATEKRGGYTPGSKLVSELKPPPRTPGTGSKPATQTVKK